MRACLHIGAGLVALSFSAAAEVPEVGWDTIHSVADARFDAGAAAARAEVVGLQRARSRVAGRVKSLWVTAEPGVGIINREAGAADSFVSVGTSLELGDRRSAEQARLSAAAAELTAGVAVRRFEFLATAHQLWLQWAAAAVLADHLTEDVAEFDAILGPVRRAVDKKAITTLDWMDLTAERARLQAEVAVAQRSMATSHARLESHLGLAVTPTIGTTDWTALPAPGAWANLDELVSNHPLMAARNAAASKERADATAAEFQPFTLDVGMLAHLDEAGFAWAAATLTLNIPLSTPGRAAAIAARGRAVSHESERDWARSRLMAEVRSRQRQHAALRVSAARLSRDLIKPLRERFNLVKQALAKGATDGTRLVRAWRDLHEAKHQRLETYLHVATDAAEARALTQLLTARGSR